MFIARRHTHRRWELTRSPFMWDLFTFANKIYQYSHRFSFFTKVKCNLNNKQYFCNKNDKMHCAKNGAHIGVYVHIYIDVFMDYLCTNARDWLLRPCKSVREYECVRTGTSAFLWLVKNYLILLYFNCLLRQGGSNNPKSLLLHWPA